MKVTVTLNGGKEFTVDVENYDATEITKNMNDPQIQVINIGNVVLGKHSIMMIAPTSIVPNEPTPEETN